jgi:hypothetical protein
MGPQQQQPQQQRGKVEMEEMSFIAKNLVYRRWMLRDVA